MTFNLNMINSTAVRQWLAHVVERRTAAREVEGWTNTQGFKITEDNVIPLPASANG